MAQRKAYQYAQAKGAPAGFVLGLLGIASLARTVYASVSASVAQNHYLNAATGLVRIQALTNGVYVAFSANANKAPAKATATLTSTGTLPTSGALITIGTTVYRIMTTPAQAYDVKRDASAAAMLDNLKAAINGTGTPGTEYFAGTEAHPDVIATTNTDTTQVIEAKLAGTAGNAIALAEDDAQTSWSGSGFLVSGADGNFDDYVPAGASKEITLDDSVSVLSLIGDGGAAAVSVVEY